MGFPRLLGSPTQDCGAMGGNSIQKDEFNHRMLDVNEALKRASEQHKALFKNLDAEFGSGTGHRYCDDPSYLNEVDPNVVHAGPQQWAAGYYQPKIDGHGVYLNLLWDAWQGK